MSEQHITTRRMYDPKDCPVSDGPNCECGGELTPHYGFYGNYGLGGMDVCLECGRVWNFEADNG